MVLDRQSRRAASRTGPQFAAGVAGLSRVSAVPTRFCLLPVVASLRARLGASFRLLARHFWVRPGLRTGQTPCPSHLSWRPGEGSPSALVGRLPLTSSVGLNRAPRPFYELNRSWDGSLLRFSAWFCQALWAPLGHPPSGCPESSSWQPCAPSWPPPRRW